MEEYQHNNPYAQPRQTAPNAVASLVLGIIGLVLSNKGLNEYHAHPELYTGDGMLQAGKITSIVGIVLGALSLLVIIPLLLFAFGVFAVSLGNI